MITFVLHRVDMTEAVGPGAKVHFRRNWLIAKFFSQPIIENELCPEDCRNVNDLPRFRHFHHSTLMSVESGVFTQGIA
jgi:hypothetical protein